jgi:hypothetical protein
MKAADCEWDPVQPQHMVHMARLCAKHTLLHHLCSLPPQAECTVILSMTARVLRVPCTMLCQLPTSFGHACLDPSQLMQFTALLHEFACTRVCDTSRNLPDLLSIWGSGSIFIFYLLHIFISAAKKPV